MEIPLSRYQTLSLDHIKSNSIFPISFTNPRSHLFKFSKNRKPFFQIRSSFSEQGLKPRPVPRPFRVITVESEEKKPDSEIRERSPSLGVCAHIEKLVLHKRYKEALELFEVLECEDDYDVNKSTFDALVNACISLRSIRGVKRVFSYMINSGFEFDPYMRNRVLLMHVKCGMMLDARNLFDEMPQRNLVSWNTIIGGLVDMGDYLEAFRLFLMMWHEFSDAGSRTLALMIRASAGLELLNLGKQLHSLAFKLGLDDDIFVSCALIDMYSKCGSIDDAQFVFDEMPEKTTVGWNSIIASYALHGYSEEALRMYYEMQDSGAKMDHFTYSIIVRICARLASLEHAKQAHAGLVRNGFGLDIVANTSLVDFYSKWGKIEDARNIFESMPKRNVISWNALIGGYGNHGQGIVAVDLFDRMVREGFAPNHVTFLAVLSACSYSGLYDIGWRIFESMRRDHMVKPRAMHYACMIELLGRKGLLEEAFAFLNEAPFQPTVNMWASLLTACRVHKNIKLARISAEKIYGMEPEKLSNYIVLLNMYNKSGMMKEAAGVVRTLRKRGLRMLPACSWIEIKKQTYGFLSGDQQHPQTRDIYEKVDELMVEISKLGYVHGEKSLLPDVDEREEKIILYHSEKLAVAFGLISTSPSTELRLVQSHRICGDCHNAIKLIAKVTKREIIMRDSSRFHRFRDGSCSCGDYW